MADISRVSIDGGETFYNVKDTTARQNITEINNKVGANNGIASLNGSGKVPESQLPSYVDDVIEGYLYEGVFYEDAQHTTPITGESGKIYVDLDTDKTYRWSGTVYVCTGSSLELGEVTGTAYDGGKGKTNADNIAAINDLIPSTASSTNKFATMQDVENATDIETTEGLIEATNGWWGKNELELDNTLQHTTIDGVSFSIGKRKGIVYWISATGTPNNGRDVMLKVAQDVYVNREKILNGCPEGGSNPHPGIAPTPIDRYGLSATSSSITQIFEYNDVGEGVTIPSGKHCNIYVVIKNGYTADDLTFRPMLRNSKIKDSSFEMYEPNTLERLETKQDKTTFTVSNGRLTFNNIEVAT